MYNVCGREPKNKLPVTPVAPAWGWRLRSTLDSREVATVAISEITGWNVIMHLWKDRRPNLLHVELDLEGLRQ